MKTTSIKPFVLVFALFLAAGAAYGASLPARAVIEVKGLACPFCVQGLEKHLKKLDAVAAVHTSLKNGEAIVDFKPARSASEEELRQAVKKAGFTAGRISFETEREGSSAVEGSGQAGKNTERET